eukprot:COSAG06_NODE_30914_length_530_cov_0.809745_1_plen_132_part_00
MTTWKVMNADGAVRKTYFFEPYIVYVKTIFLPRQARDKHRNSSKQVRISQVGTLKGVIRVVEVTADASQDGKTPEPEPEPEPAVEVAVATTSGGSRSLVRSAPNPEALHLPSSTALPFPRCGNASLQAVLY